MDIASLMSSIEQFLNPLSTGHLNTTCAQGPSGPIIQDQILPFYTFIVVLLAIGVSVLYAVGRLKLTNVEKVRRYNAEMKAFRAEMSAAVKEGNKQKQEKLKKKQQQMTKMQMEMSRENLKPTLLFTVPLIGVWYLVSNFFNSVHICVLALSPIQLPSPLFGYEMNFFWWYFICSFTFSQIITRLFGLTFD